MILRIAAAALISIVFNTSAIAGNLHASVKTTGSSDVLRIRPFTMHYRVLRSGWDLGTAVFSLVPRSGVWLFRSEAHATGLAKFFVDATFQEISKFTVRANGLEPLLYNYIDSGNKNNNEKIVFNWHKRVATDTKGSHKKVFTLAIGTQDRLTAQLMLSIRLLEGKSAQTTYTVIGGGKRHDYRIHRGRTTTVATPAGNFRTVIVEWVNPKKTQSTIFWMAPRLQYLPVKMTEKKKGEASISFVLFRYKGPRTKAH